MCDDPPKILSFDDVEDLTPREPVQESSYYKDKKAKLDERLAQRLDQMEAEAKAVLASLEKRRELGQLEERSYYDCHELRFLSGQIKAYFNQSQDHFTFLDFHLTDPSGGGISNIHVANFARHGRRNCPFRQVPPDEIAASRRTPNGPRNPEPGRSPTQNRPPRLVLKLDRLRLPDSVNEHLVKTLRSNFPMKDVVDRFKFSSLNEIGKCYSIFCNPLNSKIINVAIGLDTISPKDLPEWSNFSGVCISPKELQNSFARRLLLMEVLGHMSSSISNEFNSSVPFLHSELIRSSVSPCAYNRRHLLAYEFSYLLKFLRQVKERSDFKNVADKEELHFAAVQDSSLLHLIFSSLLLRMVSTVYFDCRNLSSDDSGRSEFTPNSEVERKARLNELSQFIKRFSELAEIENRWLEKEEIDALQENHSEYSNANVAGVDLFSVSTFGSITISACSSINSASRKGKPYSLLGGSTAEVVSSASRILALRK